MQQANEVPFSIKVLALLHLGMGVAVAWVCWVAHTKDLFQYSDAYAFATFLGYWDASSFLLGDWYWGSGLLRGIILSLLLLCSVGLWFRRTFARIAALVVSWYCLAMFVWTLLSFAALYNSLFQPKLVRGLVNLEAHNRTLSLYFLVGMVLLLLYVGTTHYLLLWKHPTFARSQPLSARQRWFGTLCGCGIFIFFLSRLAPVEHRTLAKEFVSFSTEFWANGDPSIRLKRGVFAPPLLQGNKSIAFYKQVLRRGLTTHVRYWAASILARTGGPEIVSDLCHYLRSLPSLKKRTRLTFQHGKNKALHPLRMVIIRELSGELKSMASRQKYKELAIQCLHPLTHAPHLVIKRLAILNLFWLDPNKYRKSFLQATMTKVKFPKWQETTFQKEAQFAAMRHNIPYPRSRLQVMLNQEMKRYQSQQESNRNNRTKHTENQDENAARTGVLIRMWAQHKKEERLPLLHKYLRITKGNLQIVRELGRLHRIPSIFPLLSTSEDRSSIFRYALKESFVIAALSEIARHHQNAFLGQAKKLLSQQQKEPLRSRIFRVLGGLQDSQSLELLREGVKASSGYTRLVAAGALAKRGDKRGWTWVASAISSLKGTAPSKDLLEWYVQMPWVMQAFGNMAAPLLLSHLSKATTRKAQAFYINSLGLLRDKGTVSMISKYLEPKMKGVFGPACRALSQVLPRESLQNLIRHRQLPRILSEWAFASSLHHRAWYQTFLLEKYLLNTPGYSLKNALTEHGNQTPSAQTPLLHWLMTGILDDSYAWPLGTKQLMGLLVNLNNVGSVPFFLRALDHPEPVVGMLARLHLLQWKFKPGSPLLPVVQKRLKSTLPIPWVYTPPHVMKKGGWCLPVMTH